VVWLDGLDIPMIRFFDAGFAQNDSRKSQAVSRPEGTSLARYGYNMAPVRGNAPFGATSPIFNYPYERSREALDRLERDAPLDDWDGFKLRYVKNAFRCAACTAWAATTKSTPRRWASPGASRRFSS
jgi:gentisate 1,2-dioxygenase